MDIMLTLFYAGGIIHLWDRNRSFLQCVLWPVEAGKVVCRWLDHIENERTGGPQ